MQWALYLLSCHPAPTLLLVLTGCDILDCYVRQHLTNLQWQSRLSVCQSFRFLLFVSGLYFYSVVRCVSFHCCDFDKIPWPKQFGEKGLILAHRSRRVDSVIVGKTWQKAKRAWWQGQSIGWWHCIHTGSRERKRRETGNHFLKIHPLLQGTCILQVLPIKASQASLTVTSAGDQVFKHRSLMGYFTF